MHAETAFGASIVAGHLQEEACYCFDTRWFLLNARVVAGDGSGLERHACKDTFL
jgi:hypothetical protein